MIDTTADHKSTEAFETLLGQVGRKSPLIPPETLVRRVLACVPEWEWPTRVAAMEALLRRLETARRDELRIESRPEGGRVLGDYATRRKGSTVRPYRTALRAVDPLEGSCDCPDFLKNSLGVCKHVLAVAEAVHAAPRRLKLAQKEQEQGPDPAAAGLTWDPVRPLTGLGDWLERLDWRGPTALKGSGAAAERRARALKRFRRSASGDGLVLGRTYPDDPSKRLALVDDLLTLPIAPGHQPAIGALLAHERERLGLVVAKAPTSAELRAALKGLKRTLYPYQREGLERFLAAGRLLLADDMGLGKTAQAVAACQVLWRTGRVRRGLVIAPASLKPQWAREWAAFSDLPVRVIDGPPDERRRAYAPEIEGMYIINYEQLLRDLPAVRAWAPDLVVLDEAQRIKNWATKTALSVKGLAPPFRLVLTGTPMENRVEELASVVEWVDDTAMEPKWRLPAFHSVHADGKREVVGVRHLDTLRDRLRPCMVRRVRQDVLDQLPPRTDTRVPIAMTEAQLGEHDALKQPILQLMQRAMARPLTQAEFLRLMSLLTTQRIISNGLAQLRFTEVWPAIEPRKPEESVIEGLAAPKLLELRQLVRQIVVEQGRKAVIFSQWRRMLALANWAVSDLLQEGGVHAGFFTGAEGQKRRTQNIVEFHDDPDFRILFASDAGGVGLNLQRAANCVINIELPWNPAVLEQRIGRIYRLGQTLPIDVYNLVCEQGIESRIASLVGSKQAFFKGLFDGDSDAIRFDQSTSFLARVQRLYGDETVMTSELSPIPADEDATPDSVAQAEAQAEAESEAAADLERAIETEADSVLDETTDVFEPLIEAGDESRDAVSEPKPASTTAPTPTARPAEAPRVGPSELPPPAEVRRMFSRLSVRRQDDGKIVIEAPADAATTLSALFEGMAALLQSAARPEREDGPA